MLLFEQHILHYEKEFGITDLGDAGKNLFCSVVRGSEFRGEQGTPGYWALTQSLKLVCTVIVLKLHFIRS